MDTRRVRKGKNSCANVVVADYRVDSGSMRAQQLPDNGTQAQSQNDAIAQQHHVILRIKTNNSVSTETNVMPDETVETKPTTKLVARCDQMSPNVSCFWCCHSCNVSPTIGLPLGVKDGKVHATGCFCSYECAAAFNFNSKELFQDPWTSFELLNKAAREVGYDKVVQPAPSRYSLKMFGGWMDIEEFRKSPKLVNPLPAPMMSIVQYMEEIMASDIMHGTLPSQTPPSFVPLDQDRVQRAKLNLLASNSLKSKKNTIHEKMNLRTKQPI